MAQMTVYLDEATAEQLDRVARRIGLSRSALVGEAIRSHLRNRLPTSFFDVLGTLEDDRDPDEVLRDIREAGKQPERASLDA